MLTGFLLRWLFNTIGIYLAARLLPGLEVSGARGAVVAALVLGLVNASIRWVLLIFTLPLNILTLGLFTLVINAVMLYLVAAIVPGAFKVRSFGGALVGALIISVLSTILGHYLLPAGAPPARGFGVLVAG
jgi:putative membrane protein